MRALVIMPRSPTSTTRDKPKRSLSLSICVDSVIGSACVAFKHFDRHWAAIGGAQQAVDDLQFALLAVPRIAKRANSQDRPSSQDEETS